MTSHPAHALMPLPCLWTSVCPHWESSLATQDQRLAFELAKPAGLGRQRYKLRELQLDTDRKKALLRQCTPLLDNSSRSLYLRVEWTVSLERVL